MEIVNKFKERDSKLRLFSNLFLLLVFFVINCFWDKAVFIAYPLLLVLTLADTVEFGFSYLLFSFPYLLVNEYLSLVMYLVCVFAYLIKFAIYIFVVKKEKVQPLLLISMGVFLAYCLLPFGHYNLNLLLKEIIFILVFVFIIFLIKFNKVFDMKKNIQLLAVSLLISCVISLFVINIVALGRFVALFKNPNFLAGVCEFLIATLGYYLLKEDSNIWDLLLFGVVALLGTTSYSKTFLIILTVTLVFLFVWKLKTNPKKTLIITAIVCWGVTILFFARTDTFFTMYNRFFGLFRKCDNFVDFLNMVTTDRFGIWQNYLVYIWNGPFWRVLFGYGLGAQVVEGISSHNAYIAMLYQLGIIGALLFISVVVLLVKESQKGTHKKLNKAVILPIIIVCLVFCVEDILFFIFFK